MLVPEQVGEVDAHLISFHDPTAPAAEYLRRIRSRLCILRNETPFKSLLVTSCRRNEGKTTVAINLAATLSQQPDTQVLLVDADLRKPSCDAKLGLRCEKGLGDYLTGEIDDANGVPLYSTPLERLALLSAGKPVATPSELLGSERMRKLSSMLSSRFDWIVLDTPPVLPVTDTQALAQFIDRLLLVIEAFHTSRGAVHQSLEMFREEQVLGYVMNKIEYAMTSYYRYPYSNHY